MGDDTQQVVEIDAPAAEDTEPQVPASEPDSPVVYDEPDGDRPTGWVRN